MELGGIGSNGVLATLSQAATPTFTEGVRWVPTAISDGMELGGTRFIEGVGCKFVGGRGERTGAEFPIVAMHTHKEKIQHTPYNGGKKAKPEVY